MHGFAPSAATRLFALLGDPVAHSLSPRFQNAALRHCGIDAVYVALRCDAAQLPPLMHALARAGGGGNVTVPHKALAAEAVQRPTAAVLRTRACNTFWAENGVLCGDNTDVHGFRAAARTLVPLLRDARVLVVGAGGAAAAALCALTDDGARVTLLNRTPERARTLAARFDETRQAVTVVTDSRELAGGAFDLVVNATSAGLRDDDPLPLDFCSLAHAGAALDLVYRPGGDTPWTRHARSLGIPAADGTEMLLAQGAAAFQRWYDVAAPVDVMRAALTRTAAPA